ncbi:MAG: hypothetical protein M1817_005797 [Caeruleum heppii]|nr:MAG: hypothetical protein M1817_005797 [Caeruleum heppii]
MEQPDPKIIPLMPPPPGVVPRLDELTFNGWTNEASFAMAFVTIFMLILTGLFVIMRIFTKARISRAIGLDDYICVLALGFVIADMAGIIFMCHEGLGAHMWDISLDKFHKRWVVFNVLNGLLYTIALSLVKLALLLLYLRIFKISRVMRWVIYGVIAFVVGYTTGGVLALIFACNPVKKNWDWTVTEGVCTVGAFPLGTALNILNIITDIATLVVPFPMVWSLQLSLKQKIGVLAMFATGTLVCVATLVRVILFQQLKTNPDLTWAVYRIIWPSVFELTVGLICACLPSLRPFSRAAAPWIRTHTSFASSLTSKFSKSSSRSKTGKTFSNASTEHYTVETKDTRLNDASYIEMGKQSQDTGRTGSTHPPPFKSASREPIVGHTGMAGQVDSSRNGAFPKQSGW